MPDRAAFVAALGRPDQPAPTFAALAALADQLLDLKLFTLMTSNTAQGVAQRVFTSDEASYPTGGEKPITPDAWTRKVLDRKQTFVANSIDEIAAVFPDWPLIRSLGCESCLNLPVVVEGRVLGTLNCLSVAGHFTPERVAAAEQLKLPGAVAFLLAAKNAGAR